MIATGFFGGFFGARYSRIHCDEEPDDVFEEEREHQQPYSVLV